MKNLFKELKEKAIENRKKIEKRAREIYEQIKKDCKKNIIPIKIPKEYEIRNLNDLKIVMRVEELIVTEGGENAKNSKKNKSVQKNSNQNKKNKYKPDN